MTFSVYLPPAAKAAPVPALYFLSGLTCNEDNFITKAGAIPHAARLGIALICPDTSPRGDDVADDAKWDMGKGAGFYVDATEAPWAANYRMYSYVTSELPSLVEEKIPKISNVKSVFGHSMGGHGALVCFLKNPNQYKSVSAFAPIANPINCAWGHKCFGGYLGPDREAWKAYDATELMKSFTGEANILIDQGSADGFLADQLLPNNFVQACEGKSNVTVNYNLREGYDHSYWFISTFIEAHMIFHAQFLLR